MEQKQQFVSLAACQNVKILIRHPHPGPVSGENATAADLNACHDSIGRFHSLVHALRALTGDLVLLLAPTPRFALQVN